MFFNANAPTLASLWEWEGLVISHIDQERTGRYGDGQVDNINIVHRKIFDFLIIAFVNQISIKFIKVLTISKFDFLASQYFGFQLINLGFHKLFIFLLTLISFSSSEDILRV